MSEGGRISEAELREIEEHAYSSEDAEDLERLVGEVRRLRGLIARAHGSHYEAAAEEALNVEAEACQAESTGPKTGPTSTH